MIQVYKAPCESDVLEELYLKFETNCRKSKKHYQTNVAKLGIITEQISAKLGIITGQIG
jgi:hypothetical protein